MLVINSLLNYDFVKFSDGSRILCAIDFDLWSLSRLYHIYGFLHFYVWFTGLGTSVFDVWFLSLLCYMHGVGHFC